MGQQASNNFCEDLVNGSNPRYTYSQPTPSEQVAWQVKKEDEARQAQISENIRENQGIRRRKGQITSLSHRGDCQCFAIKWWTDFGWRCLRRA